MSKSVTITSWPNTHKQAPSSSALALSNVAVAVRTAIIGLGIGLATSNANAITLRLDSTQDSTAAGCTLREAIVTINNGDFTTSNCDTSNSLGGTFGSNDTINIDTYNIGTNFNLSLGELPVTKSFVIESYSSGNYSDSNYAATINAQNNSRIFNVSGGATTTLSLNSLTLQNGSVAGNGGAIHVGYGSSLSISNSTIRQNTASNGEYGGGVFLSSGAELTVEDSTFSNNTASGDGGAIYASSGTVITLTNTTVANNTAGTDAFEEGGGIWSSGLSLTLNNSTVSGNSAFDQAGGIYTRETAVTLNHSTITGNSSNLQARAGLYTTDGALTINNSIIANSVNGADCSFYNVVPVVDSSSIIEDGSCSATVAGDPSLGPLASNSGPTQTHVLLTGSTAIDGGSACSFTQDQRGLLRDANCDVGAVEFSSQSTIITTEIDGSLIGLVGNGANGLANCSLRSALSSDKLGCTITNDINDSTDRGNRISITFDPSLAGKTIDLVAGQLDITTDAIISGASIGGMTIDAQQNSRVIAIQGTSYYDKTTVNLNSLTITGGRANGDSDSGDYGAGIEARNVQELIISSSVISNNSFGYYGGGIFSDGPVTISNSSITNNHSVGDGGGVYTSSSNADMTLINTTVSDNLAGVNNSHEGGGLWSSGGAIELTNSTISGNSVYNQGGGIYNGGSTILNNSTISDNTAGSEAGGVYSQTLALRNSIIANSIVTAGGTEDCVTDNSKAIGLGLNSNGSRLNKAKARMLNRQGLRSTVIVANGGVAIPFTSDSASIVEDGSCDALIAGARIGDPGLLPLRSNGGPTQTHALASNSIAINTGDNQSCPAKDQRGRARNDGKCDVGAFEDEGTNFYVIPLGNGKAAVIPL